MTTTPTTDAPETQGKDGWSPGAAPLRPETPRQQATVKSGGDAATSPCLTTADIGVDGDACRRRADRACVTGGGGEVGGDEEDENGELRDVDGGAAAWDEAGAATVRSLGDMVSADSISLMSSRTPLFSGRLHVVVPFALRMKTERTQAQCAMLSVWLAICAFSSTFSCAETPFPWRPPPPPRSSGIVGTRRTSRAPGGPVTNGGRIFAVHRVIRRPASWEGAAMGGTWPARRGQAERL